MFHGCRSQENEDSILRRGFQVSQCVSGGANFGTWFAYNASYSDSGFAYEDSDGIKHLFVCVVSEKKVVLDDQRCMRVVAQDCACPVWLLKYRYLCIGTCAYAGSVDWGYSDCCYNEYDDDYLELCKAGPADMTFKELREAKRSVG